MGNGGSGGSVCAYSVPHNLDLVTGWNVEATEAASTTYI